MKKISTNIYRLDPSNFYKKTPKTVIEELIVIQNNDNNIYEKVECKVTGREFDQLLYIHHPNPTDPNWKQMLLEISGQNEEIKRIKSKYPSFLLFFFNSNDAYAITGGAGHRVIESILDFQFGFDVVERLIDTSKDDIRGLSQRVFLGVELASNRFFKSDYVFNDEDSFGKYYRGVDVFIDSKKLKDIGIETDKKKLLVKGQWGFRIDTKISFQQLIERIEK